MTQLQNQSKNNDKRNQRNQRKKPILDDLTKKELAKMGMTISFGIKC